MGPPRATAGGFVVSARGAPHLLELHRSDMKLPGLTILTRRSDFLRAASARRVSTPAFTLQYRERAPGEAEGIRVGFTCSKKVGNAVARNRAKRRLREAARLVLPAHGRDGFDYVLIGRREVTAARPFADLLADLEAALEQVHR